MNKQKIMEIIKVTLEDMLLELHFNLLRLEYKTSLTIKISQDAETIIITQNKDWVNLDDIRYEIFSICLISEVNNTHDELVKLIGNIVEEIKYGVDKTPYMGLNVIYYFMIITNKNQFLFFNNGDEGAYSFDNIDKILEADIYGYEWVEKPPISQDLQS